MRWIKVKDQLPEKTIPVLTWGAFKDPMVCFRSNDEDWIWVEYDDPTFDELLGITHWMPLPEPPKADHFSTEEARLQKKAKQAMQDIDRDELDHDNVETIVMLMLEAGYKRG